MAVATCSSSRGSGAAALVKAAVLPLLLALMVVAAGASTTEDATAVAESGGRSSEGTLTGGRKLLQFIKLCGFGPLPTRSCGFLLPFAFTPRCCPDIFGNEFCFDVGGYDITHCGSCSTVCSFGQVCCRGVCTNLLTDKNNCGLCGNVCRNPNAPHCKFGFCGY